GWSPAVAAGVLVAFLAAGCPALRAAEDGPFDKYIKKPDPTYSWKVTKTIEGKDSKTFIVQLKSQTWRTKEDVDRPVWEHWVTVVVPNKPASDKAFLYISGGANDGPPPEKADLLPGLIATATNTVVVELTQIPNQPLIFHNDGVKRKEDDLIGYGWDQFLKTDDPTWLPRLPMVKSVVRTMDCVQELVKSDQGGGHKVEKF